MTHPRVLQLMMQLLVPIRRIDYTTSTMRLHAIKSIHSSSNTGGVDAAGQIDAVEDLRVLRAVGHVDGKHLSFNDQERKLIAARIRIIKY